MHDAKIKYYWMLQYDSRGKQDGATKNKQQEAKQAHG